MDELERRIRAANPLVSRRDAPLTLRAHDDLARLLAGADAPAARPRGIRGLLGRLRSRRLAVGGGISGLTVGAAIAVIAIAISVSTPSDSWALTPPPLEATPVSGTVASVADELEAAAAKQPVPDTSGDVTIRTQTWALAITDRGPDTRPTSWVAPERLVLVRHPDGSAVLTFRAGTWEYGTPPGAERRAPGTLIERDRVAAGESSTTLPVSPTTGGEIVHVADGLDRSASPAVRLFTAITSTAHDWPATGVPYLQALSTASGVQLDGAVIDRLGRHGIAFSTVDTRSSQSLTRTLIFDRSTGALLSSEVAVKSGSKVLAPGGVLSYTCWE